MALTRKWFTKLCDVASRDQFAGTNLPESLKSLCQNFIRKDDSHIQIIGNIEGSNIPGTLKDYLIYRDEPRIHFGFGKGENVVKKEKGSISSPPKNKNEKYCKTKYV